MSTTRNHWDDTYTAKAETQVSWFQTAPARSLALIERALGDDRSAAIVDVGGGASRLVDGLLECGYRDLTVLDVSEVALSKSRIRLGEQANRVSWIAADITEWLPQRVWQLWHDRAVFHFLVEKAAQDAYIAALTRATAPGSSVLMACFALDGPERCSGLPVQRYSAQTLAARLGSAFELVDEARESHATPGGKLQNFTYALFRRL